VAAKGVAKPGKPCFRFSVKSATLNESGQMMCGDLRLLPLVEGQTATVTIEPERGFDFGAGPGKTVECQVKGGTVGLVLDARGRPLVMSADRGTSRTLMEKWVTAMSLYQSSATVA
jgi:hypothetical protein